MITKQTMWWVSGIFKYDKRVFKTRIGGFYWIKILLSVRNWASNKNYCLILWVKTYNKECLI